MVFTVTVVDKNTNLRRRVKRDEKNSARRVPPWPQTIATRQRRSCGSATCRTRHVSRATAAESQAPSTASGRCLRSFRSTLLVGVCVSFWWVSAFLSFDASGRCLRSCASQPRVNDVRAGALRVAPGPPHGRLQRTPECLPRFRWVSAFRSWVSAFPLVWWVSAFLFF
jgi:hypothetical protein